PVLFADPKAGVIGAAHAGWQGALKGVLENTVAAMEAEGAQRGDIIAVLGPMISQDSYEVGPDFPTPFLEQSPDNQRFFKPSQKPSHHMFDLAGYIVTRLTQAGVAASQTGYCTYRREEEFYSYRRTTHRKEPDYGRQLSAIVLQP
ncbi:MAG: polyphenol oxidase family protein, partial [Pseudomonadota bacterium]